MLDHRPEIRSRLFSRRSLLKELEAADARFATGRLVVFVLGLGLAWAVFSGPRLRPSWLLVPSLVFLALAIRHDHVLRDRAVTRRSVAYYEASLARMDGDFPPGGSEGIRFLDPLHPYAADLDLFGPKSLFEYLCRARTGPGEAQLAAWLLEPAESRRGIVSRQGAADYLAAALDLREQVAVLGEDVRASVDPGELAAWGERPRTLPTSTGTISLALTGFSILAGAALFIGWGPVPLAVALLLHATFARTLRRRVKETLGAIGRPLAELRILAVLLARLEREHFEHPRLDSLAQELRRGEEPASRSIAHLVAIALRAEWARNQLFAPIAFALAWEPWHAALMEKWRADKGPRIRPVLSLIGEFEALSSLGAHAYEHPEHVVPQVIAPSAPHADALLVGEGLTHPLLKEAIPNSVALGTTFPKALLVSGSNMSGKSTYLRTVGTNVVLALAGARVPATRLCLTPMRLGATIKIEDSLEAGRSRFFAEITRLKILYDLSLGKERLCFLLDEILNGTNSHDRRLGAEAILGEFVKRGAIGLVTTHDLALTELEGKDGSPVANAHFEDQVSKDGLRFDYRLKPGVVSHSNAISLMRSVGLPV